MIAIGEILMIFDFLFNSVFITVFSLGVGFAVLTLFFIVFEIYDRYILGEKRSRKDRIK